MRAKTTKECIKELKKHHKNKNYDYSKVKYVNNRTHIEIICNEKDKIYGRHGSWFRRPGVLFRSPHGGCPKCDKSYHWTTKEWIQAAKRIHGNKFGYKKVVYKTVNNNVTVFCRKCKKYFSLKPSDHLYRGDGCRGCRSYRKTTTKQWVKKVRKVHGHRYKYNKTRFKAGKKLVIITCRKHGDFKQRAQKHLGGHGCRKCGIGYSLQAVAWMNYIMSYNDSIEIVHAKNGGEYRIPGTNFRADGYDEPNNTIYEFLGDYWHGNPYVYYEDAYNKKLNMTFGDLYKIAMERIETIKNLGYDVEYIWESDWKELAKEEDYPYRYDEESEYEYDSDDSGSDPASDADDSSSSNSDTQSDISDGVVLKNNNNESSDDSD